MTKKGNENSGGYALCSVMYIVMCAILRVVVYFLSVNLLHYMYAVFVALCVAQHFPLKE